MNKREFIERLTAALAGLSESDIKESVAYYAEMIDDRTEDGLSEEEAIAAIGSPEDAARQILMDMPLSKVVRARVKPKRKIEGWEIALLIIGAPLWLPLLIVAIAVFFTVYVVMWSILVVFFACDVSLAATALGAVASSVITFVSGNGASAAFLLGGGIVCAGLAIFAFFGCTALTKALVIASKKILLATKSCFIRKEAAK